MRRQEIPASTNAWEVPEETSSAFPEEPLAKVCTVVKKDTSLCKKAPARENVDSGRHPPQRTRDVFSRK